MPRSIAQKRFDKPIHDWNKYFLNQSLPRAMREIFLFRTALERYPVIICKWLISIIYCVVDVLELLNDPN